ncbi:MAG TPA: aminoacyl-tRNA hydrolase [Patescibacteria group bacterium]|nr:aminoacyl-tRNA hydrolase [Patescibacteria group bacterium]
MKLIVGLGNPGEQYRYTRHNAGFLAVDYVLNFDGFLAARPSHEFKSEMFTWQEGERKAIFLKPQTYMNDSGQALKTICNFYKLDLGADLLVIHDDVDLPFGTVRQTASSSAAGHNGIKSIIENLGTQDFHRLRIGIETRPARTEPPTDAFVLQSFTQSELADLKAEIFPQIRTEVSRFLGFQN